MPPLRLLPLPLAFAAAASAQPAPSAVDVANLREDVRDLSQKMNDLSLRVEQLEHENAELTAHAAGAGRNFATQNQLNEGLADLNRTLQAAIADAKADTLQQVSGQVEKLARQTNAALDSVGRGAPAKAPAAAAPAAFSENYPKEGVSYTVQRGDTLALIAKKTGAHLTDIVNANKISDPSRIQVGQTLFIPGGK